MWHISNGIYSIPKKNIVLWMVQLKYRPISALCNNLLDFSFYVFSAPKRHRCQSHRSGRRHYALKSRFRQYNTEYAAANLMCEPRHDKTSKMAVRPTKTQISLGRVFAVRRKKLGSLVTHWAHSGCPGWSESSLGAHSFCWFCHVVAHVILSDVLLNFIGRGLLRRIN